jgi:hypothetical protein
MPKRIDPLTQLTALRTALQKERTEILERLTQIESALGDGGPAAFITSGKRGTAPKQKRGPRARNKFTIREAVAKATAGRPLSLTEIVQAVTKLGYKFSSKNPQNSLGAFLYGKEGRKHFKRVNGKFVPK